MVPIGFYSNKRQKGSLISYSDGQSVLGAVLKSS
jgi:hypothetical protein